MYIYIDESGSFMPLEGLRPKVSAVCGLIIPSKSKDSLFRAYRKLLRKWNLPQNEVKGSQLSEKQFEEVFRLLKQYKVLMEAVPIDAGNLCKAEVITHQRVQASRVTSHIPDTYDIAQREFLLGLSREIEALSPQLYVQWAMMINLIHQIIITSTLYHSLHSPAELNRYHWIIDAKAKKITPLERTWSILLPPILHARSAQHPMLLCYGANVSSLNRFYVPEKKGDEEWTGGYDLQRIFRRSHDFRDSSTETGLQLVDIMASALTRAFNGTLRVEGWGMMGWLLLTRDKEAITMSTLTSLIRVEQYATPHQGYVIRQIGANTRSLWEGIDMAVLQRNAELHECKRKTRDA